MTKKKAPVKKAPAKKVVKEKREPFKVTSLSAVGAKSIVKQYTRFGYKHIDTKYDTKKEVYINTFK